MFVIFRIWIFNNNTNPSVNSSYIIFERSRYKNKRKLKRYADMTIVSIATYSVNRESIVSLFARRTITL